MEEARRYRVVLAHGRAAEFEIPALEQTQWGEAVKFALSRVGSSFAGVVDVDYASFGDLWRPDLQNSSPVFRTSNRTRVALEGDPPQIMTTVPGPQPGAFGVTSTIADALLPDLVLGRLLRPAIPDVFQYLEDASFRTDANKRLVDRCLKSGAGVLIGFSMGTIVGYDVLRTADDTFPVRSFITAGSPIGLGPVNRPLRTLAAKDKTPFPPHLRLWMNIWNDNDVATGVHGEDLAGMFPDVGGTRTIQSGQNFGRTASRSNLFAAHDAMDYFSSLAMGVALHTALLDIATEPVG
jgi:hypothetical protein